MRRVTSGPDGGVDLLLRKDDKQFFGPYLRMRLKFDQESVREAAGWLNKQ